jgi:predicted O-methyltransferase YrrM
MKLLERLQVKAGVIRPAWVKRGESWLSSTYGDRIKLPPAPREALVEQRAAETNNAGAHPLIAEYGQPGAVRTPDQVRSTRQAGRFYADLARRRPGTIVEFGAAFGTSGMYWMSGLEAAGQGRLLSFEPNEAWAAHARANIGAIGSRYILTVGTFEDNIQIVLKTQEQIDVAFVDAIHTSDFVKPQFELVMAHLAPGGIVILDDIDFSDDMASCWKELAVDHRVAASFVFNGRVGVIQAEA